MCILYLRLPSWIHGAALTPSLILIDRSRKWDKVLLAHEMVHAEQMADVGTVTFWFRYFTDRAFRQFAEVEAYQVSVRHAPERIAQFATALSKRYRLGLSFEDAVKLIQQ